MLEDANAAELADWAPKIVQALRQLPELEDVASNAENNGLSAYITVDRDTAARFGITMATVDNALYDAYGQRIVTTIFTQTNQYRVILEAQPDLQKTLRSLDTIYLPSSTAGAASNGLGQVPLTSIAAVSERVSPLQDRSSRPVSGGDDLLQRRARRIAGRRGRRHTANRSASLDCRRACSPISKARRSPSRPVAQQRATADPRRHRDDVHHPGRALRELHPPDHDSLDLAVGRRRRASGTDDRRQRSRYRRHHRHHSADRHRQEERDHDDRLRARRRAARRQTAARSDPPGEPAALSARS